MQNDNYNIIQNHPDIPSNCKYYWGYQYNLGHEIILPYLKKLKVFQPGQSVVEIGSAEGGVLAALVNSGAVGALATDIASARLELGRQVSEILNLPIQFQTHDIINEPIPSSWENKADLVILRDVIEHLDDTTIALSNIKKFLKPGGFLYVTFPPYYSPFGGHQHIVMNKTGKIPFIHWLPNPIFYKFIESGSKADIEEVKRLQKIRLTPKKFISSAESAGYQIVHNDYYLLRPVFKMKFGLPTIKITPISFLPFVKNVFSLEASYILKVS